MATTLDLDELLGSSELMEIRWQGKIVYALHTDVSSRILLAGFSIIPVSQRLKDVPDDATPEEQRIAAEAAVDGYYADVHKVCLRIVQHTLPEETSEALNAKLSEEAQEQVVKAFFTRRSRASSQQPQPTDETSSDTAPTTMGNRVSRRARSHRAR